MKWKVVCAVVIGVAAVWFGGCGQKAPEKDAQQTVITERNTQQTVIAEKDTQQTVITEKDTEAEDIQYKETEDGIEQENANADPQSGYGTIEEIREEFTDEEQVCYYYYMLDKFRFYESTPAVVNESLEQYFQEFEEQCKEEAGIYTPEEMRELGRVPYTYLHFLNIGYAGEDYVSMVYNHVADIGGVNPESWLDGITIDCKTGEMVNVTEFLGKIEEAILQEVSDKMGTDVTVTWEDVDFYVTDSQVVFFYRIPNIWEDVILER